MPLYAIVMIAMASIAALAFVLSRIMTRRDAPPPGVYEDEARIDEAGHSVRDALRFLIGPFPLSVALHVLLLLILIATIKVQNARELLMVTLQQVGGGGGSKHDEMRDVDMPELSMPDTMPQMVVPKVAPEISRTVVQPTRTYVRDVSAGGIGTGGGNGIGSGSGPGMGAGFGGFIGELRRKGLDIVLVIDDTGSMDLIINDVRDRMDELVMAIHRLVPIARIGIVVFGGRSERVDIEPLTISSHRLQTFLNGIGAKGHGSQGDVYSACVTAVNQMNWKPYAKKVIVLVGDSPPRFEDYGPLLSLIARFRAEDGTFNAIDVSAEEHERYEREFWLKTHNGRPPGEAISPLAEFYQDTRETYKMLAAAGGGGMRPLTQNVHINEQVLILALGAQWQGNLAAFGRQITENEQ
jgi:von Willebrand factor type A domain